MFENISFADNLSEILNLDKKSPEKGSLLWNLLESLPTNISIWAKGELVYANAAFYKAVGVEPGNFEELTKLVESEGYFVIHPDDFDDSETNTSNVKNEIESGLVFHKELRMKSRIDNDYRWYNTYIVKGKDPENKVIIEVDEDINEKKLASEKLKEALSEKDTLLKEVHHRVKNNFQVISSLLKLQSRKVQDPEMRSILDESQSRIILMAGIHEMLYRSTNLNHIDFGENARELTRKLVDLYGGNARNVVFEVESGNIDLSIDKAIPCTLILNEIISNSLKYAFKTWDDAKISIILKKDNGKYELKVSDNGTGFPEGFDNKNTDSMGLLIVNTLAAQIGAEIISYNNNGAVYEIRF
jgi:two-component sensor histidine kinase